MDHPIPHGHQMCQMCNNVKISFHLTRRGFGQSKDRMLCHRLIAPSQEATVCRMKFTMKFFKAYGMLNVSQLLTLKVLVVTIDAQWEGMGDVGSARYEPAILPPCPTIRVLSYSN